MTFLISVTPSGDARLVFPNGLPRSTIAAEFLTPHCVQAFTPEASRALRFASSSLFHLAYSSAASVPM